jgi:para-nitrobenzyl esterase
MGRQFIRTPDYPVVETKYGKVKGFVLDGIFTFQGIRYGKAENGDG